MYNVLVTITDGLSSFSHELLKTNKMFIDSSHQNQEMPNGNQAL